jgi:hypothetical protein
LKSNYSKWDTLRIVLTLTGYLVLACTWGYLVYSHHSGSKPKVATPYFKIRLRDQYDKFNAGWFGDELSHNVTIGTTDDPNLIGRTDRYVEGENVRWVILENFQYNQTISQADLTLLHEMCHIKTWDEPVLSHGPRWVGCMRDLAKAGSMDNLW